MSTSVTQQSPERSGRLQHSQAPSRRLLSLLVSCCVLLVLPIWIVQYPPLVDYPNHLARTFILSHLNDSSFHFAKFYSADWVLYPYLAMDAILVGLEHFIPAMLAGRLFLSSGSLFFPITRSSWGDSLTGISAWRFALYCWGCPCDISPGLHAGYG